MGERAARGRDKPEGGAGGALWWSRPCPSSIGSGAWVARSAGWEPITTSAHSSPTHSCTGTWEHSHPAL